VTATTASWLFVGLWAIASMGGGALLALLARRLHPTLSLYKLWIFYTAVLGFTVAAVMAIVLR
jgi:hypothetical protein